MKIKELKLYTHELNKQINFYENILGLQTICTSSSSFSVQIGWTLLSFEESEVEHFYHYCFLIPSNKLEEAIDWLKLRLEPIETQGKRIKHKFESWNAESIYFYDGSGNLAEFIVRYDLNNEQKEPFTHNQILCVNEIGLPSKDINRLGAQINEELRMPFWKGDLRRFGTFGSQHGLFLVPNPDIKRGWFPTDDFIKLDDLALKVWNEEKLYEVEYKRGVLKVN